MKQILTILAVDDFQRSLEFYRAAFGFKQTVDVPVYAEFEMEDGRKIGIYDRKSFGANTGVVPLKIEAGQLSGAELYFHCEDPEEQCAKLIQAGAVELSPWQARAWGDDAAYFRDFDGHVIVIAKEKES
ncbi:MAG: VOC family protein [Calditrichaeota bacterium]|nr:VOC family protein [Calditrichota bacterium]MCB9369346.1 VOC family protein [Calditrichota bacterium]